MRVREKGWKGICILGLALAFTLLLTTSPALAWWNESWKFRRAVTIQSDNALGDYQILVQLNSSNFDFSKTNPDGSDIRFVDEDDTTKLNYWIEEWDNINKSAKVWVKDPTIPAGEETIYIYYNNSEAVSGSDGDAVFEFFDDFEGDLSKWTVISGTDYSIESGLLKVIKTTDSEPRDVIRTNTLIGKEAIVEYDIKPASDSDIACAFWIKGAANEPLWMALHAGANIYYWDGSTWTKKASGTSYRNADQWNKEKVIFTAAGEIKAYTNDNLAVSLTGATAIEGYVGFRKGGGGTDYIDNFRVRKYTSPEPSVSVGAEEEYTSPSTPQDPNLQITCILPFTLKISLTFPESGFIFIGTSPDKFCYAFKHQGSGEYTLTASFIKVNETYYVKACDNEGVNCTNLSTFTCEGEVGVEEKNFTTAFNKLMQGGDILNISKLGETVPSIYTSILSDMFWAVFFGSIFLAYWIRQEDVMLPSIVGMIGGVAMIGLLPPSAQHIAYILLTLSIAGTLYTIIKARR